MQSDLHTAIIMDGNGRWATGRGLSRVAGHRAGAEALRRIVEAAPDCGIGMLTVYAFSSDNWRRPQMEVDALRESIDEAERLTRRCERLHLRLAIDYSARDAIVSASNGAAGEHMTRERFEVLLGEAPPVDILIRTGGEQRLSDFLLWECAYAELIFSNCMWPDFGPTDLQKALRQYAHRERRFGAIPQAPARTHDHWLR
jgi:undecaprenyl diphosphate synthase